MKQLLYIFTDLLIVFGSILLAYYILDSRNVLAEFEYNFGAFQMVYPFILCLYLILMYTFGLYNTSRQKLSEVIYSVFLVSFFLMIGIMAICFFIRYGAFSFPRSVILLSGAMYLVFLGIWRFFLWKITRNINGVKNIIIIGEGGEELSSVIRRKYSGLYRILNTYKETDINLVFQAKAADEIFLTSQVARHSREKIFLMAAEMDKDVYFIPEYDDLTIMCSSFRKTDDIPTYHVSRMGLSYEEAAVKRGLDLLLGSIAFIVALPIGLLVSILIKLDGGTVFYSQERLTVGGNVFRIFKFRTMIPDAEKQSGPVLAGDKDPRITRIGHFIRATRLDELPQILNILKGDMSIVGPRPERPFFTQQFENQIPEYSYRLKVKAGLTGLAQVEGKYNTNVEDKLRYDLIYINNYSLFRDLLIMLQTVKILFMKSSTEGVATPSSKCKPINTQIESKTAQSLNRI